jgi:hypothetical protein
MLNCWKTVNLSRDIGLHRIVIFSILTTIFSFIAIYLLMSLLFTNVPLKSDGLTFFILAFLLVVPFHKMCHIFPAFVSFKKIKVMIHWKYLFPLIDTKFCQSLPRWLAIVTIMSPTLVITLPLLLLGVEFPQYMHYFTILAAYNIGLSITDFIFLSLLLKAPKKSLVENFKGGCDILIHPQR